jgi:succinate-semialdehyde dehydrogenase/glutarate-semialdehyde dehydrogenase
MNYPSLGLLIDGEWIADGRETMPVCNPATGQTIAHLPLATLSDIDRAIDAADRAFLTWKNVSALERGRLLQRIASAIRANSGALASVITMEQGKTLREAQGEIGATADTFEWMAEEGKRVYGRVVPSRFAGAEQLVVYEPIGPVGAFSPWNYPAVLAARKVATALAAGCTVVLKPAEETPGILVAIGRICTEAGLPPGVLNILYGVPAQISERLIASPKIKKLSFTGSVPVGHHLSALAGAAMKKITLELGGHAPVIVDRDVDVGRIAELAVAAKFRNAGQVCHAPTRFLVHDSVFDALVSKFSEHAAALRVGNGLQSNSQMGPLINARRLNAMLGFTEDAAAKGARIVVGGNVADAGSGGFFWQPTVIADAAPELDAMQSEVFGPIALFSRFDTLDSAIETANSVEFGLASYAFTRSVASMQMIQERIAAGSVSFNTFAMTPPEMPFSGVKQSGMGSEMGTQGLLEHFNLKSVIRAAL